MINSKEFEDSNTPNLFKNVKFYSTGILDKKVSEALEAGGAKSFRYLSGVCTLCIVGQDPNNDDISEATELLEIPVVTQDWVTGSLNCGKALPTAAFSPSTDQLMSGVSLCVSGVGRSDACSIWAMVTFYGGEVGMELTAATTHLVATSDQGNIYQEALGRTDLHLVTPDWISDSVSLKSKCDEMMYHPSLLVTSGAKPTAPAPPTSMSTVQNIQETRSQQCSSSTNNNSLFLKPVFPSTSSPWMLGSFSKNYGKPFEVQKDIANNEIPDQPTIAPVISAEVVSKSKQKKENSQDLNSFVDNSSEDIPPKTDDPCLLNKVYSQHSSDPMYKKQEKKPKRNKQEKVVDTKADKPKQQQQSKRKVTNHPMFVGPQRNSAKNIYKGCVPSPAPPKKEPESGINDITWNLKKSKTYKIENKNQPKPGGSGTMRKAGSIIVVNPLPSMITMIEDKKKKPKKPKLDYENLDTVDPSIIEEQAKIEEQIKQQISDQKYAQQLQDDLERQEGLPNEYNLRKSTKKRSLRSLLVSSPKRYKNGSLRGKSKLSSSPKTVGELKSKLALSPMTPKSTRLGGIKRLRDDAGSGESSDEEEVNSQLVKKMRKLSVQICKSDIITLSLPVTPQEGSGNESEEF